jgi:serine/threonine-protein kinase
MGEVYCAEDTKLQRRVALKRVGGKLRSDPEARRRFLHEALRTSALTSDHIAGVYDLMEDFGEIFLVMEYVEGQTLRHRLRQALTLEQFLAIALQCAQGLATAHEGGVLHCDIKPENIMLTASGQVKILDFGLAKHLPRSDQSSTLDGAGGIAGTLAYMAPEVLQEKGHDARADLYALGVVFYEALAGHHPFDAGTFVATVDRILHEQPIPLAIFNPNVPSALEMIVAKMMAKDPALRYPSMRELLADLRDLRLTAAPDRSLTVMPQRTEPRLSWRLIATVVATFFLCLASTWAVYRWTHPPPAVAARSWALIADFDNFGDPSVPDKAVREALTIALEQSRYVNVLPRPRVYEALARMRRSDISRIDETIGREICRRENARVLLAGSIARIDNTYQITVQVTDPVQGQLLFGEKTRLQGKEEFFEALDSLARRVRKRLGESLPGIEGSSRPLAKVTTRSLEALQLYSQALDLMAQGKVEQASPFLQSALALDPNFAMAHLRLAECHSSVIGKNERAVAELRRAYELRPTVTDRERLWIEAQYHNIQERYELAAQSFAALVGLYPDDAEARQELALAHDNLGQLDSAIAEQRRALELNPNSVPGVSNLVLWLARNNQNDDAIRTYEMASQRGMESPHLRWGLGLAYLGREQVAEAREQFQRMSQGQLREPELGQIYLAMIDLYEGKVDAAQAKLALGLSEGVASRNDLSIVRRHLLSRIRLLQGDRQGAGRQAERILAMPSTDLQTIDILSAGSVLARAGNAKRARQILHRLAVIRGQTPTGWNNASFHSLEGEILLAEGKVTEALTSFRTAAREFPEPIFHLGLARAYQREPDWNHASQELEQFLRARGEILQHGFPCDLALAHLELGRMYGRMSDPARAQFHYQQFLAMWRQADDLPSRRLASRELQRLRSN